MEQLLRRVRGNSDEKLVHELKDLAADDCALEADLLVYIGEVDHRGLYRDEGCSSMFAYCTRILHLAEGPAYRRIHVARAARRFPLILRKLRLGEVHLSALSLLVGKLTEDNVEELLAAATHKTKREVEAMLADREPKPDAATRIRQLPDRPAEVPPLGVSRPAPLAVMPCERSSTEPLGERRYKVQFTATAEAHDLLQEARALLSHQIPDGELGEIFTRALRLLVEEIRRRRFALVDSPRKRSNNGSKGGRTLPAEIRRNVYQRDGGRCTFMGSSARRCGSREFLQYHHLDNWAEFGVHKEDRIVLRCQAHNQLEAERDFGRTFMKQKRRAELIPG
jgi:hypothetical protein